MTINNGLFWFLDNLPACLPRWDARMPHKLDRYSSQAEALPVFLVFLPLVALISAIMPEGFSIQGVILKVVPFIGSAGFAFVASQIGADFGKRRESELWAK